MSTLAKISLTDYDRMIAEGAFESHQLQRQRIELIRGELREMSPIGPTHETLVDRLNEWSFDSVVRNQVLIRNQNSIGLVELESAPEPDIAWVVRRDYSKARPIGHDVLLVVEVSDSSLAYDRGAKVELYAEAGIRDYWLVNAQKRCVEVFRDPAAGRYQSHRVAVCGEKLQPLLVANAELNIDRLFG